MNSQLPLAETNQPLIQPNRPVSRGGVNNTDNNQEDKGKNERFDAVLLSAIDTDNGTIETANPSLDSITQTLSSENHPLGGNTSSFKNSLQTTTMLTGHQLLSADDPGNLTETSALAESDVPLATATVAGVPVSTDNRVDGANKPVFNQNQTNNPGLMAQTSLSRDQMSSQSNQGLISEDASLDGDLDMFSTKLQPGVETKSVGVLSPEMARLTRQIVLSRSMEKDVEKLASTRATTLSQLDASDTSLSLLSPNINSIVDGKISTHLSLPTVITNPQWANDFGERVRWLLSNNIQRAEIRLNPGGLGMIDISISVEKEHTNIQIVALNPLAKDAVEASLEKLREMLESSGVKSFDVEVSQYSEENRPDRGDTLNTNRETNDDETPVVEFTQDINDNDSLIDFYA